VPSSSGQSCLLGLPASEDEGTMNFAMACIAHPTILCNILEGWHFQLHNSVFEFGFPVKLVRLIKVCLNETYSRVQVAKHLSDMFPIRNGLKQGDALSPLLFHFVLECAIRRVQVNHDGLKLNDTHQLLVYAADVNMWAEAYILYRKKQKLVSIC
jgi:hypothetical protein